MAGAATLLPSPASQSASALDPAAFKGERAHPSGAPSDVHSSSVQFAPLSFGAEPQSWPLKQIDQDFVNAAFQLSPSVVPLSQFAGIGLNVSENRPTVAPGRTSTRTMPTAVRE